MPSRRQEFIPAKQLIVVASQSVNRNWHATARYQSIPLVAVLVWLLSIAPFGFLLHGTAYAQASHQTNPLYSCGDRQNNHCYAQMNWIGGMQGAKTDIKMQPITCNGACSSGGFLDYEMWVSDSTRQYWVEAGISNEAGYGYTFSFWADSRPGGGFHNHYMNGITEFGKDITFYIFQSGTNQFQISKVRAGVNGCTALCSADWTNYSTNNSLSPSQITIGAELAGSSGASSPTVDFTYNYYRSHGNWYAQGAGNQGSGEFGYNPPYEQWVNNQVDGPTGGDFQAWCC